MLSTTFITHNCNRYKCPKQEAATRWPKLMLRFPRQQHISPPNTELYNCLALPLQPAGLEKYLLRLTKSISTYKKYSLCAHAEDI